MQPSQTLPDGYCLTGTFDITRNGRLVLLLNLLGLGLAAGFGGLFNGLLYGLRPFEATAGLSTEINNPGQFLGLILSLILITAAMVVLHEAIHGVFFWWYTRSRPKFAFKIAYAYAAAPGWYLPRRHYLVIGLAPLVLISLGGIILVLFIPPGWFLGWFIFLVSNAAGAVGDLWVMGWLLLQKPGVMAEDRGDAVALYNQSG